jgi:hydroxymethylglutaryl-CoA reductase (NADPH)
MEVTDSGGLYASLTMPNLIVGSVGGGTSLPSQKECLEMMDCYGNGKAKKFAEICCALALAGELSIAAAISSGHFVSAHRNLGRKQ